MGNILYLATTGEDPTTRVYVSQLPIGITTPELEEVFGFYGSFLRVNHVTKLMHGRRIDTVVCLCSRMASFREVPWTATDL